MPYPRTADSDNSDNEGDGAAEHEMEYQKLERQYRLLENDRDAYTRESSDMIRKQKKEIDKLNQEHDEMEKDLKLIESRSNHTKDEKQCENLSELGKQKRDVEQEIEDEKKKHQELDARIRELEKKLHEQQLQGGGQKSATTSKSKDQTQKNVRKLEDQLQLANNKFGKTLEANKELRSQIDNLRVERQRFDNLYKKLDKEKQDLQRETGEVIDQSTQAYDQRVEAQEKMIAMNERSEKDIAAHNTEMKDLVRIIDHERKLREFMNTKGRERDEDVQLVTWRKRKEAMEAEKKKAGQTDSVESYEAAFSRIKDITREDDIDLIVKQFIEVEDQNFALFNFVNDQNNEIELLQEQIEQVTHEIESFKNQGIDLETQRQFILTHLEEKQTQISKQAENCDNRQKELSKIIDQLKAGVSSLFNKISCERTAIDDMLGVQEGVTDQNLLQYLGIVEARTNQLLLAQAYVIRQKDHDEFSRKQPSLLGEGPQPHHQQPSILPPAIGDEYDSEGSAVSDDENRPYTREELIAKAMRSVRKRESAMKKQGYTYEMSESRDKSKKKEKHSKGKTVMKA